MTQKERVYKYMQEFGEITPMDAFQDLGVTKLATVVSLLIREDNKPIVKEWTKAKNRFGEPVYFMKYRIGDVNGRTQNVCENNCAE